MSRKIDITQALSDEDIAYLKSRGREYDIARNKEFVSGDRVGLRGEDPQDPQDPETTDATDEPKGDPDTEVEDNTDDTGDEDDLSLDELKALAKAKGLPVSGSKSDLKERLAGA